MAFQRQQHFSPTRRGQSLGPTNPATLVAFQRQQRISLTGVVNHLVWDRLEQRDYPLLAYRRLTLEEGAPAVVVVQPALECPRMAPSVR